MPTPPPGGAIVLARAVVLHVPKTGGCWAATALRRGGLARATIRDPNGYDHPTAATVRLVVGPDVPLIAVVREPLSWLASCWRFFHARDWRPGNQIVLAPILDLRAPTFAEFAARYASRRAGFLTRLFASYADGASHVCRQEHLLDDLCRAFDACVQPYVRDVLATTPRENASRRFAVDCPASVVAAIREAEREVVARWYAD